METYDFMTTTERYEALIAEVEDKRQIAFDQGLHAAHRQYCMALDTLEVSLMRLNRGRALEQGKAAWWDPEKERMLGNAHD